MLEGRIPVPFRSGSIVGTMQVLFQARIDLFSSPDHSQPLLEELAWLQEAYLQHIGFSPLSFRRLMSTFV